MGGEPSSVILGKHHEQRYGIKCFYGQSKCALLLPILTVPSVRLPGPVFPSPPCAADTCVQPWAISFEAHPATQANQEKTRILLGAEAVCS